MQIGLLYTVRLAEEFAWQPGVTRSSLQGAPHYSPHRPRPIKHRRMEYSCLSILYPLHPNHHHFIRFFPSISHMHICRVRCHTAVAARIFVEFRLGQQLPMSNPRYCCSMSYSKMTHFCTNEIDFQGMRGRRSVPPPIPSNESVSDFGLW